MTLDEIGHLREIAEQYAYNTGNEGAFRRLSDQIASKSREIGSGAIWYPFDGSYDFGSVQFSHGRSTVKGWFSGVVTDRGEMLRIEGESSFHFSDVFTDPLDLRNPGAGSSYRRSVPREHFRRKSQLSISAPWSYGVASSESRPVQAEIRRDLWDAITEVGGTAYELTGDWAASFVAEMAKDESRSLYYWKD